MGKGGDSDEFSDETLKIFNEGIVKIFYSGQDEKNRERDLLTADYYKVLTTRRSNQISETTVIGENVLGAFTSALLGGCSNNNSDFPAVRIIMEKLPWKKLIFM